MADVGQIALKWDPKNLEIRTMSVEKTLEPLVLQVTTLVNTNGPIKKKKCKCVLAVQSGAGEGCRMQFPSELFEIECVCVCVCDILWVCAIQIDYSSFSNFMNGTEFHNFCVGVNGSLLYSFVSWNL